MADPAGFARQTLREARRDNITGEAAKVAFYLFLSLFPLVLVLFSLTGLIGGDAAFQWIMGRIQALVPGETATFLEQYVRQVTDQSRPDIFSLGLLLTLWAASGGFAALADGLNTMYDLRERRSWWRKRVIAVGLLLAAVVLVLGGAGVILAGPALIDRFGLPEVWFVLRWPVAFALVVAMFWLVYLVLPNRSQRGALLPTLGGAAVGAALWLLVMAAFRLYVANFARYSETYGFVGAVIVLMLWLQLTAAVALFGGEVAAVWESRRGVAKRPEARRAA
ncbi:MAG: YihY/virulence factor BrkB family protein [Gemmatimonadota bacterium]